MQSLKLPSQRWCGRDGGLREGIKGEPDSGSARSRAPGSGSSTGLTSGPVGDDMAFLGWRMGFK
ncbi:hypothetical protein ACH5RR_023490, partial [Cinchona calisaya]